uniref:Uncharacterized protein n=1 Tax=Cajanus cajan TaxID=3821 RepID=A0A151RFV6_CAJCA|nr:hypothetical protein KK1_037343 [Cajanus cajan]
MQARTNAFHSWIAFTYVLELEFGPSPYDIRRDVLVQGPTTLMRCVSLAKLFEEKYAIKQKSSWSNIHTKN